MAHLPKRVPPTTCPDVLRFEAACRACDAESWEYAHRCAGPWAAIRGVIRNDTNAAVAAWAAAAAQRELPRPQPGDVVIQVGAQGQGRGKTYWEVPKGISWGARQGSGRRAGGLCVGPAWLGLVCLPTNLALPPHLPPAGPLRQGHGPEPFGVRGALALLRCSRAHGRSREGRASACCRQARQPAFLACTSPAESATLPASLVIRGPCTRCFRHDPNPRYGPVAFSFYTQNIDRAAARRILLVSEPRARQDPLCGRLAEARHAHLEAAFPELEVVDAGAGRGRDWATLLLAPVLFRDSQSSFGLMAGLANKGQVRRLAGRPLGGRCPPPAPARRAHG
jgi:hypothetical protein